MRNKIEGNDAQESGKIVGENAALFTIAFCGERIAQCGKEYKSLRAHSAHSPNSGNCVVNRSADVVCLDKVGCAVNKKHTKAKQYRAYGYLVFSAFLSLCVLGGDISHSAFRISKMRPLQWAHFYV